MRSDMPRLTPPSPGYRGPDRRAAASASPLVLRRIVAGAVAGSAGAGALDLAAHASSTDDPARAAAQAAVLAVVTWSVPLLLSAVLLLCAWRVGGRADAAHWAAAAVLAGGAGPGVAWLAAGAADPAGVPAVVTASLATALALAAAHARAAHRGAPVQTDLRPSLAVMGGACLVLAAGAMALAGWGNFSFWRAGWPAWTPLSVLAAPGGWWLLAVLGAAGGGALAGSGEALHGALRRQQLRGLTAMASLHRYQNELADDRLRRHDARSALAAVRAASTVLSGQGGAPGRVAEPDGGRLAAAAAGELAIAVQDELARVERLLAGPCDPPVVSALHPRPGVVDLCEAARPVVAAWRARGLDVHGPGPAPVGSPPVLALGDADAVRRLLGNLLDNAARHAPGAAVRTTVAQGADGCVVMRVHDDGPGVPVEARDAIFQPGVRLRNGRALAAPVRSQGPGEGLGLASARALAEADGGSLRLLPTGQGAAFELRLPAAAVTGQATGQATGHATGHVAGQVTVHEVAGR